MIINLNKKTNNIKINTNPPIKLLFKEVVLTTNTNNKKNIIIQGRIIEIITLYFFLIMIVSCFTNGFNLVFVLTQKTKANPFSKIGFLNI
jgi:hypothetical protein